MATSDRTISKPIVNILTKAQYQGIASPSADEFYLITDDAAVSAGTGISVNSAGGETIVSLDSSYAITSFDITTGTDTTNKLVSAKTIADVLSNIGGSGVYLQKVNSTVNQSELLEAYNNGYIILGYDDYTDSDYTWNGLWFLTSINFSNNSVSSLDFINLSVSDDNAATNSMYSWSSANGWIYNTIDFRNYSASSPISISLAGVISHANSGVTAQTTQAVYPFTVNSTGHITGVGSSVTISDTKVTNTLATTTKYYVTGTTSSTTNTGTQSFDSGIYATTTAGQLNATTYLVNEKTRLEFNSTTNSLDFIFI